MPLYEEAKMLYIRMSDDEMSIVLRKFFASNIPMHTVLTTSPSVISSEWIPSHEKKLTAAMHKAKRMGDTRSVLLFLSRK